MKRLKLTPQNQLQRLYEDIERVEAGRRMDFSIGAHVALLIQRVDALERAASVDTRPKDEDPAQTGASLASGAVPKGDAPTPPEEPQP